MADEQLAPEWVFEGKKALEFSDSEYITPDEIERIEAMAESLSDDGMVSERERIEASVGKGSLYHVSSKWDSKVKASLKEYAVVCGMDMSKFKIIDPEIVVDLKPALVAHDYRVFFNKVSKIKLAEKGVENLNDLSREEQKDLFKEVDKLYEAENEVLSMHDPFKLDKLGDMSHMEETNWQDTKRQANLGYKPSMEGSVVPVRGGEDYFVNSDVSPGRGMNSITDPKAIETYAESEEEDTGARLRRENEERSNSREVKHKAWQDEKVASMEGSEILPQGKVFPTEAMNAQPGIRGTDVFGLDSVPEKTEGEKIAQANEDRRKEIQGSDKEDHEFIPKKAPVRGISDTFASELAKHLK